MKLNELRQTKVADTPFALADQVLSDEGVATDGTIGGMMDAIDISKDDVHALVCYCHGGEVSGEGAPGVGAAFYFSLPEVPVVSELTTW